MRSKIILALVVMLVSISIVSATIVNDNAPSWRGDDNTTSQAWEFADDSVPAVAEVGAPWDNSYGMPLLLINDPFGMTDWIPDYQTAIGKDKEFGIWSLYAGQVFMSIPNTENTEPGTSKKIWIQVTYYDPGATGGYIPSLSTRPTHR